MIINRLSNSKRFIAKKHCSKNKIRKNLINQTQISSHSVLNLFLVKLSVQLYPLISWGMRAGQNLRMEICQFYNRKRAPGSYFLAQEIESDKESKNGPKGEEEPWRWWLDKLKRDSIDCVTSSDYSLKMKIWSFVTNLWRRKEKEALLLSSPSVYSDSSER